MQKNIFWGWPNETNSDFRFLTERLHSKTHLTTSTPPLSPCLSSQQLQHTNTHLTTSTPPPSPCLPQQLPTLIHLSPFTFFPFLLSSSPSLQGLPHIPWTTLLSEDSFPFLPGGRLPTLPAKELLASRGSLSIFLKYLHTSLTQVSTLLTYSHTFLTTGLLFCERGIRSFNKYTSLPFQIGWEVNSVQPGGVL